MLAVVEKVIIEKLTRIFGLKKVTFDRPSDSEEQECVFVNVTKPQIKIIDAREIAKIEGVIHVFANSDKLPFGYFAKRIQRAALEDTRGFFFGPEENVGTFRNIAERKFDFTFLFDSQYDPALGNITSVNLVYPET